VEVDTDLVETDLAHKAFAQLCCVGFGVCEELGVIEPGGIEFLPKFFEFLVKLLGPSERLFGHALIAVDDPSRQLRDLCDSVERM
jgi:hypothetical protein